MGCPCELRFHADTKQAVSRAVEQCLREIKRFENKYSRYRPDSVTSSINQSAGRDPVPIDPETAALLEYAAVCHEQSEGSLRHHVRRVPPSMVSAADDVAPTE